MSYNSEIVPHHISKRMYFLNGCWITGSFDTKFTTIVQVDPILQKSKDTKIDNVLNLEWVCFLVTCINVFDISIIFVGPPRGRKWINSNHDIHCEKGSCITFEWIQCHPVLDACWTSLPMGQKKCAAAFWWLIGLVFKGVLTSIW